MAVTREELLVLIRAENAELEKRLKQSGRSTEQFEEKVKRAAKTLIASFGAAAAVRGLVRMMDAFDRASRVIVRESGASGAALARLDRQFKEVLGRVPDATERVATVFGRLASQTEATGATLQGLTQDVLDAARVLGEDAVQNTELFTRVLQQWQVPAEQQRGLLQQLFGLSRQYGVGLGTLNTLLVEYGAVLTNAGFSLQETAALQARLTQAGINWTRISPGINAAFRDWAGEGKDLRAELGRVIARIAGASSETKALSIAMDVFGDEGASRLARAIRQGVFALDDLDKSLGKATESIQETARATEPLSDRWNRFTNLVQSTLFSTQVATRGVTTTIVDVLEGMFRQAHVTVLKIRELIGEFVPFGGFVIDLEETKTNLAKAEKELAEFVAGLDLKLGLTPDIKAPGDVSAAPPIKVDEINVAAKAMTKLDLSTLRVLNHTRLFEKEGAERLQALAEGAAFVTAQRKREADAIKAVREIQTAATQAQLSELDQQVAAIEQAGQAKMDAITEEVKAAKQAAENLAADRSDLANRITAINKAAAAARQAVRAAERKEIEDLFKQEAQDFRELEAQLFRETLSGQAQRLQAIDDEFAERRRFINENVRDHQRAAELIALAEQAAVQKRIELGRQHQTFWQLQLQQLVDSNVFSLASISNQFSSAVAGWMQGLNTFAQFWAQLQNTLLTAAVNFVIQWMAQQALMTLFGQEQDAAQLAAHTAMEKAKTAVTATAEAARAAAVVSANAAIAASMLVTLATISAVGNAALAVVFAVAQAIVAIMLAAAKAAALIPGGQGIAGALITGATILEIGATAAVAVAAGAIQTALGSAIVAASKAFATPLAHGGIMTGPTFSMMGEASPEAAIPLNARGARFMQQAMGLGGETHIHVHVEADGRELAHVVARWMPGELDTMGVPLR